MAFTIKVKGTAHRVDADTPLLWVLRDMLGICGTKFGCGIALCGACTVHLDGTRTRSCVAPVGSIGNEATTTIEAISKALQGKALQEARLELEVVQSWLTPAVKKTETSRSCTRAAAISAVKATRS